MAIYWLILTLLVTLSVGLVAFINKVFASRKYDQRFSAIVLYGLMFLISVPYMVYAGYEAIGLSDVLLSILWGCQIYSYSILMMTILRYLPTSTFFISARLSSSFLLLFIGIIFFKDIITSFEIVGFVMGIIAMAFLFEKERKDDADYIKGFFYLILAILSLVIGHTIAKYFSSEITTAPTILVITFFSAFLCSLIVGYGSIQQHRSRIIPILKLNIAQSLLYFTYFVLLFFVYDMGDLGISYKIQSYSPFIPIVLAMIIYREKITARKAIAIFFSILSLWFFV